jgi:hypothetical protein
MSDQRPSDTVVGDTEAVGLLNPVNSTEMEAVREEQHTPDTAVEDTEAAELNPVNSKEMEASNEPNHPPNSHIGREDHQRPFDHTNRRVVIHNVIKHMRPKEVEQMVLSWKSALLEANIKIAKFKKPMAPFLNVTLESESMVPVFLQILNSGQFTNKKGGILSATRADDRQDRGGKHARSDDGGGEEDQGQEDSKKAKLASLVKTDEEVRDATAPLWRLTYDQQLDKKSRLMVNKCLVPIIAEVKAKFKRHPKDRNPKNDEIYEWMRKKIYLEPILGAPIHVKYRNKCEFTFVSPSSK